jgi:hypothetical protein
MRDVLFVSLLLSVTFGEQTPLPLQENRYSSPINGWIQGEVKESQAWVNSGDSTVLIVSEIQKGELGEAGYVSEVFGYRFTKRDGKWKKDFEVKDANQSPNEIVHYQNGSIYVKEVDGTGGAETLFFYIVASDGGTEPLVLKMIFHWNGEKATIRGKIPRELDAENTYQMTLDPKLKTSSKPIRDFAVEHWKSYIKSKYGELAPYP